MQKAEIGWWKRLLRGDGKPPHYVKVDWDKWVDEDEDDGSMHVCNHVIFLKIFNVLWKEIKFYA